MPTTSNPVLTHFAGPTRARLSHHVAARPMTHSGILTRAAVLFGIFTLGAVLSLFYFRPLASPQNSGR